MYSKLKPFAFMGVSNSEMFLSEKDLSSTMEFSFVVRPVPLEFQQDQCQIAPFKHDDEPQEDRVQEQQVQVQQQQQQQEEDKSKLLMSPLELVLPSSGEEVQVHENGTEEENNGGFKTPTSMDHKIPVLLKCPPAPRKPKSLPSPKRKALIRRRILLDLTKEIESLFPAALLADLGNKIKKVRQRSDFK